MKQVNTERLFEHITGAHSVIYSRYIYKHEEIQSVLLLKSPSYCFSLKQWFEHLAFSVCGRKLLTAHQTCYDFFLNTQHKLNFSFSFAVGVVTDCEWKHLRICPIKKKKKKKSVFLLTACLWLNEVVSRKPWKAKCWPWLSCKKLGETQSCCRVARMMSLWSVVTRKAY